MIPSFPQPYKDELFYSLIARWQWLARPTTSRAMRLLFGRQNARVLIEFPAHLSHFVSQVGTQEMDFQRIVHHHSLLPLYAPFIDSASIKLIEQGMTLNGDTGTLHRSGAMRIGYHNPDPMRYCPSCSSEERAKTGEAYWHRLHQLAGVFVCPVHRVFLEECGVYPRSEFALQAAETNIPDGASRGIESNNPDHSLYVRLAKGAMWLLENWKPDMPGHLYKQYLLLATRRGYVGPGGSLIWKRILPDFQARYSSTTLEALQCSIPEKAFEYREFWLSCLLRHADRVQPPMRHLLVMDFLGRNAEAILEGAHTAPVFETNKRACTNPTCPKFRQDVMEVVCKLRGGRKSVWSSCPVCGRKSYWGRVRGKEREFIVNFGWVWDSMLETLWNDNSLCIEKIALQLGVTAATVKKKAVRLQLPFPRIFGRYISKLTKLPAGMQRAKPKEVMRLEKRNMWLHLSKANPTASRSELQKRAPGCHSWLYNHDREWLKVNLPTLKIPASPWRKRASQVSQV